MANRGPPKYRNVALFPANPSTTQAVSTKLSAHKDQVIYASKSYIIIRDLVNPASSKTFAGHGTKNTTVARFSPSGYYCASADETGTVKVWDTVGEDQSVKGDFKVLGGPIKDLAWDGESKRLIAVGDGRGKFAHAFTSDTGNTSGEIGGHSKAINAVAIRNTRPYRAVTASDDGQLVFHAGPPFKFEKVIKTHTKFVQDVQYAPSGDYFASVGSDRKIFLYDGKTADTIAEFTEGGHNGSIMACAWSPDSKSFMTASLDTTVKLWDIESHKPLSTWTLGSGPADHANQQLGAVFAGTSSTSLISISKSGDLNVFDPRVGDAPARILRAPQKAIKVASPFAEDGSTFLAGDADGRVFSYDVSSGDSGLIGGQGHTGVVGGMTLAPGSTGSGGSAKVFSVGNDSTLREIEYEGKEAKFTPASCGTNGQPISVAVTKDRTVFFADAQSVRAIRDNQILSWEEKIQPSAIAAASEGDVVAVASAKENGTVYIYKWTDKLNKIAEQKGHANPITSIALSSDGSLLAWGDSEGKIVLVDLTKPDSPELISKSRSSISRRVQSLAFLSSGKGEFPVYIAAGGNDTNVRVWKIADAQSVSLAVDIVNAVPTSAGAVWWLGHAEGGKAKLAAGGDDGCVRVWEVTLA